MSLSRKLSRPPWFSLGLAAVFLVSVYLRFWGLSRFNTLVFDEVYYAKFANDYLTHTQFFNAHPPLSQYLIAIAMWIGSHIPIGQDTANSFTGSWRSTWSYRWLNALTGSFIPLVVAGIAYQLNHRRSYALIAAIFAAADGLFLVESRYALNNVYLVILGLFGQWFLLLGLEHDGKKRQFWLVLAGIGFGASAAIKWNGLWFLFGAYLTWITAWAIQWVQFLQAQGDKHKGRQAQGEKIRLSKIQNPKSKILSPLENLTQLKLLPILFYLGIIPVLVYSISWIPHLLLVPQPGFWEMQKRILAYHEHIGSGPLVHPYCSAWYTWPLMLRPVAYFYKTSHSLSEPVPIVGPTLPAESAKVIYDVHAMANPLLWWFSTAAIAFLFWKLAQTFVQRLEVRGIKRAGGSGGAEGDSPLITPTSPLTTPTSPLITPTSPLATNIALYLILNWLANLLPWIKVTRCIFIYHYMGSSVFAGLALAWLVDNWLHSLRLSFRVLGLTVIFLVLLAFVFWMPLYLGLPLSPESYKLRLWFRSWI